MKWIRWYDVLIVILGFAFAVLCLAAGLSLGGELRVPVKTVVSDQGPVVSDQGPVVSDQGPVVSDQGPVVSDQGPVVSDQGSVVSEPRDSDHRPLTTDHCIAYVATMPGCGPCEELAPSIRILQDEGYEVYTWNPTRKMELWNAWRLTGTPTIQVIRGGQEIGRRIGSQTLSELRAWLQAMGLRRDNKSERLSRVEHPAYTARHDSTSEAAGPERAKPGRQRQHVPTTPDVPSAVDRADSAPGVQGVAPSASDGGRATRGTGLRHGWRRWR